MLGRDEKHGGPGRPRDRRVLDNAQEITADGDEGGLFLLALGVLALEQQRDELRGQLGA
jgi:hypothetical protein